MVVVGVVVVVVMVVMVLSHHCVELRWYISAGTIAQRLQAAYIEFMGLTRVLCRGFLGGRGVGWAVLISRTPYH